MTSPVFCTRKWLLITAKHAAYCEQRGGSTHKIRAANDPSVFIITEKAPTIGPLLVESAYLFSIVLHASMRFQPAESP